MADRTPTLGDLCSAIAEGHIAATLDGANSRPLPIRLLGIGLLRRFPSYRPFGPLFFREIRRLR